MAIGNVGAAIGGALISSLLGQGGVARTGQNLPAPATGANLPVPSFPDFVAKMEKINFLLGLRGLQGYNIQEEYDKLIAAREAMNERYGERERALEAVRQTGPVLQSAIEKILYKPDMTKDSVQTQLAQIV